MGMHWKVREKHTMTKEDWSIAHGIFGCDIGVADDHYISNADITVENLCLKNQIAVGCWGRLAQGKTDGRQITSLYSPWITSLKADSSSTFDLKVVSGDAKGVMTSRLCCRTSSFARVSAPGPLVE